MTSVLPSRLPLACVLVALALTLLGVSLPAWSADRVHARIERMEAGNVVAQGVELQLTWAEGQPTGEARLRAEMVELDGIGYAWTAMDWRCRLRWREDGQVDCSGPVRAARGPVLSGNGSPQLEVVVRSGDLQVTLGDGPGSLRVGSVPGREGLLDIVAVQMPVAWLQALSSQLWADGQLGAGLLDGRARLDPGAPGGLATESELAVRGVGFDTPDGLLAGEGVDAALRLRSWGGSGRQHLALEGELTAGELLAGPVYVPLPDTAVAIELDGTWDGRAWAFERLAWDDPGTLSLQGRLAMDEDLRPVEGLLQAASGDAGTLGERYLSGILAPAGLGQLRLHGALDTRVQWADGQLATAALDLHGVNVIDGAGRFSFAGLRGAPRWTSGPVQVDSTLSWSAAALYGLGMGAVDVTLESRRGEIGLAEPIAMDLLGGRLSFDHFVVRAGIPDAQARVGLGLELSGLDLGALSQRLGWPAFTGTVQGRIPSAVYADNVLRLDGGLNMQVFGGQIEIGALALERPFGVAPTLTADVDFRRIDLAPLTAAFGFGEILGELAGRIHGLRLLDWSPVAFDAQLYSDPDYRGVRRISQRAVRDISNVGGNLIVTGLQNQVLRLFSDFAYRRMGIRCRLSDQVCLMDGIGSHEGGYTIIEGRGLPRLMVVGYGRWVDWPVLVERLRAVTEGQMPIID